MSAEKKYTERDKVLFQREGVDAAVKDLFRRNVLSFGVSEWEGSNTMGRRLFPVTVTRPRVVTDYYGEEWSIARNGMLQHRAPGDAEWNTGLASKYGSPLVANAARVKLWAELLANPTEEIAE